MEEGLTGTKKRMWKQNANRTWQTTWAWTKSQGECTKAGTKGEDQPKEAISSVPGGLAVWDNRYNDKGACTSGIHIAILWTLRRTGKGTTYIHKPNLRCQERILLICIVSLWSKGNVARCAEVIHQGWTWHWRSYRIEILQSCFCQQASWTGVRSK